ncbi:hypothetical protein QVD17_33122 [Tagetes erecta]|uniref:O-methyltransferase n=1 Tax=Tagetes erecta TaxID=13708 RepID=A0AAD8NKY3_TARER|nr:hypothetical protein QVD17_33122 [Tagetes erecta]
MAFQSDVQSKDLLNSQAHIWNHIFSFIKSMSLKCAIELEIPDIINRHGSPMLLSELVEALAVKQERTQFVYRLMRVLVHSGFVVKQVVSSTTGCDEGYLLAPVARLLLKDTPLSFRPCVLAMLNPIMIDPCQNMSKWFQNDDLTPFHTTHGTGLWELSRQETGLKELFNEALASDSRFVISVFLEQCGSVFQGLDSIVDVGGRSGTVAKAIAKAFPNIRCISFDLPHVVNGLAGSENMTYVGGDMFEAIPNANAILIK